METEHQLFMEMMQKYGEIYPDSLGVPNKYENWSFEGDWSFHVDVQVDHSKTVTRTIRPEGTSELKEIDITKTPFEISLSYDNAAAADYYIAVLDADGNPLSNGRVGGPVDALAINGADVSTVYVYICDYVEYMDELKGYYYSPDYAEKSKTKTFRELLEERSLCHEAVTF